MTKKEELKAQILELTREYYKEVHAQKKEFEPGKSFVHYGGRYFNDEEIVNLVDSSLDFWLTQGPWTHKFERRLADWLGVKYCVVTNSGSSANLLAFYTLTSPKLGDRRIKKGDEVITVAAGFPTTVTPIIQYGAIPVFVDVALPGFDIDVTQLEAAYSPKTKAVMMAHSLGNPFNLKAVLAFCEKHNLWLIEDNCDALGSEYTIDNIKKCVTEKTKVISLAHVSNVIGDVRDVYSIGDYCHKNNIIINVDGSQSVPHMKVDFKKANIDFLSFSSHKMCGPTGVGVLIGKEELLNEMEPIFYGGGMNSYFEEDGSYELKKIPERFEAGTPPIAEVIGLDMAIKYLMKIGIDNIHNYELDLRNYFVSKVKDISNIIIYNKNADSGIISINIDGVFSQDTSVYLNHYRICVRAGNHCAKMLKDEMNIRNTVRISFYFYNTYEEIDKLIEVLKNSKDVFKIVI